MRTHGLTKTKEYMIWGGIVARCEDQKHISYSVYGGAGIKLCEEWRRDFTKFLAYIGNAPSKLHTVDRIDGTKGYEPGNVRWATRQEQSMNTKNLIKVEWNGKTHTVTELSAISGIDRRVISKRLKAGWPIDEAMSNVDGRTTRSGRPKRVPMSQP